MTYTGHLYAGAKMRGAMDCCTVQTGQNATKVGCECRQHLGAFTTHTHEPDGRLGMCAHLGAVDDADGIDLGLPSCRAGYRHVSRGKPVGVENR